VCGLCLAAACWLLAACGTAPDTAPPLPDTSDAEPAVEEAIRRAREEVVSRPGSGDAWGRLGMVLDAHDYVREAHACYRRAGTLQTDEARWSYLLSFCVPGNDPEPVLDALERARALRPEDPAINLRLGETLLEAARPEEAREAFEATLAAQPGHSHALVGLARIEADAGETERARSLLEAARRADPAHRPALALLSSVLARQGDLDEAREVGQLALSLGDPPPPSDPYRERVAAEGVSALHLAIRGGGHLQRGELDQAIDTLTRALAARDDLNQARVELGQALLLAGRPEEGLDTLRSAVAREPGHIEAKRALAAALAATGDLTGSAELCREVLGHRPGDAALRLRYATLLVSLGRAGEALDALEKGAGSEGGHPEIQNVLAWLLATLPDARLRDGARAVRLAEELCRLEPTAARLGTLACAYGEAGRFTDALRALGRAESGARRAGDTASLQRFALWRERLESNRPVRLTP
jgi:tetratricopeptide (TPR) repeat protein